MYQDVNGYLWFATDRGISRYDGEKFKNFGLADGLTGSVVFEFVPQPDGTIWCTTYDNTLFYFHPKDYVFHPYKYNDSLKKAFSGYIMERLTFQDDGTLLLCAQYRSGYLTISPEGIINNVLHRSVRHKTYRILVEHHKGQNCFFYASGLHQKTERKADIITYWEPESYIRKPLCAESRGELTLVSNAATVQLWKQGKLHAKMDAGKVIVRLGFLDDQFIWAGTAEGGVKFFDLDGNEVQHFFPNETVTDILRDHEGGFWLSTTSSGVHYVQNHDLISYRFPNFKWVNNISTTANGEVWVGFENGQVYTINEDKVIKIVKETDHWNHMSRHEYNGFEEITYADGNVTFQHQQGVINERVRSSVPLISDDKGAPIIIFSNQQFGRPKGDNRFLDYQLEKRKIIDASSAKNGVLLGTRIGVFHYDTVQKKHHKLNHPQLDYFISDIDRVDDDFHIIGTKGNGVIIRDHGALTVLRRKDGMLNDIIKQVYVENDSTFWTCSTRGINMIQYRGVNRFSIFTFEDKDGLPTNDVTDIEVLGNNLWIGTKYGLYSIPKRVITDQQKRLKYFDIIRVEPQNDPTESVLDLSHDNNHLEIEFKAISFARHHTLEFRYRLKGLNDLWNIAENKVISYKSLPPGEYTLEIQVGMNGKWMDQRLVQQIRIHPPFYQTWWFRLIVALSVSGVVYLFFRFRILSYNQHIFRELIRQLIKRIRKNEMTFVVRMDGKEVRVRSKDVLFVSAAGNYIEIHTTTEKIVVREKISNFLSLVPDPMEYLQIKRSHIVRIDQISRKSRASVVVGDTELKIGKTYQSTYEQILF